jgi:hypothetical protein
MLLLLIQNLSCIQEFSGDADHKLWPLPALPLSTLSKLLNFNNYMEKLVNVFRNLTVLGLINIGIMTFPDRSKVNLTIRMLMVIMVVVVVMVVVVMVVVVIPQSHRARTYQHRKYDLPGPQQGEFNHYDADGDNGGCGRDGGGCDGGGGDSAISPCSDSSTSEL